MLTRRATLQSALAVSAAALFLLVVRPARVQPQVAASTRNLSQFRIIVGLTDTAPKDWRGSLTVTAGELVSATGWRFSQQDRVDPNGDFSFRTKIGPLENQLLTAHPYGQTGWGDKAAQRLIPEGLIVRVAGTARVHFAAGGNSFDFAAGDVAPGRPLSILGGNGSVERLPIEERLSESGAADDYPSLAVTPDGQRWVALLSYQNEADRVLVSGARQIARSGRPRRSSFTCHCVRR